MKFGGVDNFDRESYKSRIFKIGFKCLIKTRLFNLVSILWKVNFRKFRLLKQLRNIILQNHSNGKKPAPFYERCAFSFFREWKKALSSKNQLNQLNQMNLNFRWFGFLNSWYWHLFLYNCFNCFGPSNNLGSLGKIIDCCIFVFCILYSEKHLI